MLVKAFWRSCTWSGATCLAIMVIISACTPPSLVKAFTPTTDPAALLLAPHGRDDSGAHSVAPLGVTRLPKRRSATRRDQHRQDTIRADSAGRDPGSH